MFRQKSPLSLTSQSIGQGPTGQAIFSLHNSLRFFCSLVEISCRQRFPPQVHRDMFLKSFAEMFKYLFVTDWTTTTREIQGVFRAYFWIFWRLEDRYLVASWCFNGDGRGRRSDLEPFSFSGSFASWPFPWACGCQKLVEYPWSRPGCVRFRSWEKPAQKRWKGFRGSFDQFLESSSNISFGQFQVWVSWEIKTILDAPWTQMGILFDKRFQSLEERPKNYGSTKQHGGSGQQLSKMSCLFHAVSPSETDTIHIHSPNS